MRGFDSYSLQARVIPMGAVVLPAVVDTPFFERRGRRYDRVRPIPIRAERIADAIVDAAAHDRGVVYVPGWMQVPARIHGVAPRAFRWLAERSAEREQRRAMPSSGTVQRRPR